MSEQAKSPSPGKDGSGSRSRSPSPRAESPPRAARSQSPGARESNGGGRDDRDDRDDRDRGRGGEGASSGGAPVDVNPGNNVYVANLAHRLAQADLEEMFSKFGRLEKCELILDPVTRESRGFAFVTYEDVRDAADAVQEMNGKEMDGRRLRVEIAKRRRGHEKTPGKYLGPRLASSKYGRDSRDGRDGRDYDNRDFGGRRRSRSRDRDRDRSRSRDRYSSRRYDDRDRYERRYDDRGRYRNDDRYDDRRRR